jgi:hypothetical protein
MKSIGVALYAACVDFMLRVAQIFGITYRDANASILLILFPVVTVALLTVVLRQRVAIGRLRRRLSQLHPSQNAPIKRPRTHAQATSPARDERATIRSVPR